MNNQVISTLLTLTSLIVGVPIQQIKVKDLFNLRTHDAIHSGIWV